MHIRCFDLASKYYNVLYKNTLGAKTVRTSWKHHLILMFIHATNKGLIAGRGMREREKVEVFEIQSFHAVIYNHMQTNSMQAL